MDSKFLSTKPILCIILLFSQQTVLIDSVHAESAWFAYQDVQHDYDKYLTDRQLGDRDSNWKLIDISDCLCTTTVLQE